MDECSRAVSFVRQRQPFLRCPTQGRDTWWQMDTPQRALDTHLPHSPWPLLPRALYLPAVGALQLCAALREPVLSPQSAPVQLVLAAPCFLQSTLSRKQVKPLSKLEPRRINVKATQFTPHSHVFNWQNFFY